MAKSADLNPLFENVEDLIKRVADIDSAEIRRLRARVRDALVTARGAVVDGAAQIRRQAQEAAEAADGYVQRHPWQSVGAATVFALALGVLIGSRRDD